mmetsp:Transcript_16057/g.44403  ORF Transcript_16057/g.44403 Transcript_16057/m.44403 type:complete len:295 (+) Transcript_16057:219-1103(+)
MEKDKKEDSSMPIEDSSVYSNPLGVAILYEDASSSTGCSHSIPWDAEKLIGLQHCPICTKLVGMVCDGSVPFVETQCLDDGNKQCQIIRFKFGKKIYQLSTTAIKPERPESKQRHFLTGWMRSYCGEHQSRITDDKCMTTVLAQSRIAQALNLASLKILHKGKVLYPIHSSEPIQEAAISQMLLKISDENWNVSNGSKKKKIALVVMGTSKECQLKEPSNDDGLPRRASFLRGVQRSIWFPISVFRWSVQLSWHFFTSFFAPLLPSFLLRGEADSNSRSRSNNRNIGQMRHHQD